MANLSPNGQEKFLNRLKRDHALPLPPKDYVRCDDEKFQMLNASQILWITGEKPKCGKSTVVKASLSYLKYRLRENQLDDILWKGTKSGKTFNVCLKLLERCRLRDSCWRLKLKVYQQKQDRT